MKNLVFGIDLGIASCGWAVLRLPPTTGGNGEIIALGSWMFDAPETSKERTPKNQVRRSNRLLRRVIRRRAQRMGQVRRLFHHHGLIPNDDADALKHAGSDPWELRARALDKSLSPAELAVALGHIAKRRGFRSATKRKDRNTAGDDQKMLRALEETRAKLGRYRTMGELFAREFVGRKRNRDGIFDRTQSRDDLEHEAHAILAAQRRLGNPRATAELEEAFIATAFQQRPMQDSERLVGMCPFEPAEKRAAHLAPSFELFRLLTRLVNLRIDTGNDERPLTADEIVRASADPGRTAKLSAKEVRKCIGLPAGQRFTSIRPDEEDRDIATRTGSAMTGTRKLRNALGEDLWRDLQTTPEKLDAIAHALSFFETQDSISRELGKLELPTAVLDAIETALADGDFADFKGAAGISAKAARAIIPYLQRGLRYDEACTKAGYDHAASRWSGRKQVVTRADFNQLVADLSGDIANPVARKALTEALKQLWAMKNRFGLPDAVHIELARDVGNSLKKRQEIEKGLNDTTTQRERERDEARALLGIADVDGNTLLRYRLWKEQAGRSPYSDKEIPPHAIIATDNSIQVDHILPWSRFGDDSFNNKVLCFADENQRKKGRTPYEWILPAQGEEGWRQFAARIETNKAFRGYKKRNYLLKNAKDAAERFRSRNLNDTRYACRLLAEAVRLFYPEGERQDKGGVRRVFTRPGALTAALRHAWGIESLKKVDGKRVDDARHHALDALVVAAISEWEVQKLTRSFQEWGQQGLPRPLRQVDPPWGDPDSFRRTVKEAFDGIFVARPERRRARGEGHKATIRQVRERDGTPTLFERVAVLQLGMDGSKYSPEKALKQLDRVKDPERSKETIKAIRNWLCDPEHPRDVNNPPRHPRKKDGEPGPIITKIRLATNGKPALPVRGGAADRGDMVRVDMFSKPNRKGKLQFYLVPIYPHQVMDRKGWPQPPKPEIDKKESNIDKDKNIFSFYCSIYPRSYVEIVKPTGQILMGYFQGLDISTGAINLFNHRNPRARTDDLGNSTRSIGAKTLLSIRKYAISRFGERDEVKSEVRTWHGVACTFPPPPD